MILADTEAACRYTGRKPEVLYRWAREGRIRRYGTRQCRLWDLTEMTAHVPGQPLPKPPKPKVTGGD